MQFIGSLITMTGAVILLGDKPVPYTCSPFTRDTAFGYLQKVFHRIRRKNEASLASWRFVC